jgi:uncharacterized protein YcbX
VSATIGTVALLARYPVKSMAGEYLSEATVERRGLTGDRGWAVCTADGGIGSGTAVGAVAAGAEGELGGEAAVG